MAEHDEPTEPPRTGGAPPQGSPELSAGHLFLRFFVAGGAIFAYALSFSDRGNALPTFFVCPTRLITSLPCPSCGFTRSWFAISSGDFAQAYALNVLSFVAYVVGFFLIGMFSYEAVTRRNVLAPWMRRHQTWMLSGIAILVVARYVVLWTVSH